jgi:hypothetical protein
MMQRDERWARHRASVERWKAAHREYYLEQKRRLATRPEYLARRRMLYAACRGARSVDERSGLSTKQNSHENTDSTGDRRTDP